MNNTSKIMIYITDKLNMSRVEDNDIEVSLGKIVKESRTSVACQA